jgi:hypothetical protein
MSDWPDQQRLFKYVDSGQQQRLPRNKCHANSGTETHQELEGGKGGAQHQTRVYLRSEPAYGNSKALLPVKENSSMENPANESRGKIQKARHDKRQETHLSGKQVLSDVCSGRGAKYKPNGGLGLGPRRTEIERSAQRGQTDKTKGNPRGSWASDTFSAPLHGSHYVVLMMMVDTI